MSRIAGILTRSPQSSAAASRMLSFMAGRAGKPHILTEAVGAFGWIGTGHGGVAKEGSLIVCFDGVLFNRDELHGAGDNKASDAAILLHLVRRHGLRETLGRVNGDFGLAIVDLGRGSVDLARDRVGAKPLYYAMTSEGIAFASRCGALLGVDGVSAEPNHRFAAVFAGAHYRSIDNVPEESPYRDIAQVPAATIVSVLPGQSIKRLSYWKLNPTLRTGSDEAPLAEEYRALLLDAVGRRVARSRRPAFTLSGGLDSSSVLSCAMEKTGTKHEAFSTVYSDTTYDESHEIRSMLESKVSHWNPVAVDNPAVFDLVRQMVHLHDEPVATATWLSHYVLVGEVAGKGFDALFGGLGGDELNAGEFEYFIFHFADMRAAGEDAALEHEIHEWARHHDHPIYRKGPNEALQSIERLTAPGQRGRVRFDPVRLRRYYSTVRPEWYDLDQFQQVLDHPFESWMLNRTYQDIFRETAPCCLRAEDRHTSGFGIDRYDPFFDHRLIEFMFGVPGSAKIRDGITKRLLRAAMKGILPEETRTRVKKTGWNAPAHRWFSEGQNLADLQDMIASRAFRERGLYNPDIVRGLLDEHLDIVASGRAAENHMMFFWQLVNVEMWLASIGEIAGRASKMPS
jgi:asparagine synthase (glutamine-hydrolysing)